MTIRSMRRKIEQTVRAAQMRGRCEYTVDYVDGLGDIIQRWHIQHNNGSNDHVALNLTTGEIEKWKE